MCLACESLSALSLGLEGIEVRSDWCSALAPRIVLRMTFPASSLAVDSPATVSSTQTTHLISDVLTIVGLWVMELRRRKNQTVAAMTAQPFP